MAVERGELPEEEENERSCCVMLAVTVKLHLARRDKHKLLLYIGVCGRGVRMDDKPINVCVLLSSIVLVWRSERERMN